MAFDWKNPIGNILSVVGAATGNPLLAAGGGAIGGGLTGGWKGAVQGGLTGGLSSLFLGGKGGGFNPLNMFGGGQKQGGSSLPSYSMNKTPIGSPVNFTMGMNPMKQESSFGGLGGLTKNSLFPGLATMVGSQFIGSPKVPELPQSIIDFQNQAKGGNPLQNQAQAALMEQLNQTKQGLGQDEIDAITRQYDLSQEQELKSVDSMYKSLRPGTDPLTDTAYQKDLGNVRNRYATMKADSLAQANRQISNDFNSQRAQQIAAAAGLSNQQMQQLGQMSELDLNRALAQFNIDDRDKQFLRNYIFQFGGDLVANKLGVQNSSNDMSGLMALLRRQ